MPKHINLKVISHLPSKYRVHQEKAYCKLQNQTETMWKRSLKSRSLSDFISSLLLQLSNEKFLLDGCQNEFPSALYPFFLQQQSLPPLTPFLYHQDQVPTPAICIFRCHPFPMPWLSYFSIALYHSYKEEILRKWSYKVASTVEGVRSLSDVNTQSRSSKLKGIGDKHKRIGNCPINS